MSQEIERFRASVTSRRAIEKQRAGKVRFKSRAFAKQVLGRRRKSVHGLMRVYRCPWCGLWHMGHVPGRKSA